MVVAFLMRSRRKQIFTPIFVYSKMAEISKREHENSGSEGSDNEWIGPTPAEAAPPKKRKSK